MKHGEIAELSTPLAWEGWMEQGARELCHVPSLSVASHQRSGLLWEASAHPQRGRMAAPPQAGWGTNTFWTTLAPYLGEECSSPGWQKIYRHGRRLYLKLVEKWSFFSCGSFQDFTYLTSSQIRLRSGNL